jgi:hypothetical protein
MFCSKVRHVAKVACVLGGMAIMAALALATWSSPAAASDRDCPDFSTQRAAQIYFLKHGGPRYDPDRLDADHDGVACEDNPCPCYYKKHLPRRPQLDMVERL